MLLRPQHVLKGCGVFFNLNKMWFAGDAIFSLRQTKTEKKLGHSSFMSETARGDFKLKFAIVDLSLTQTVFIHHSA